MRLSLPPCSPAPGSAAGQAGCKGRDLFPLIEAQAPVAFAAVAAKASEIPFGHGKLFRLSREGGAPSYLFATLHLNDPRITDFSPQLRAAIAGSKTVALETNEIGAALLQSMRNNPDGIRAALLARQDQRPDRLLNKTEFAQLEAMVVRHGLGKSAAGKLKPSILALLLDLPICAVRQPKGQPYADELIAEIAHENKIPVVGLETMIEQLSILDGLPRNTERDLLVATLRQADHAEDVVETTIARYQEGDLGGLLAWMQSAEPLPGVVGAQTPPAFLDRLITLRNRQMRDEALPLLMKGEAFIAVGAAHLPGKVGLLQLLQEEGYHIENIEREHGMNSVRHQSASARKRRGS